MLHLQLEPRRDGYMVRFASSVRAQDLRGGLPRVRSDLQGAAYSVSTAWYVPPALVPSVVAFVERIEQTGEAFSADLIIGDFQMRPHTCEMQPGSAVLRAGRGGSAILSMRLQVEQLTGVYTDLSDEEVLDTYEALGDGLDEIFAALAKLVNVDLVL